MPENVDVPEGGWAGRGMRKPFFPPPPPAPPMPAPMGAPEPMRAPAPRPKKKARRQKRSEEHTSELQSHLNLVCRLLLEKKNTDGYVIIKLEQIPAALPSITQSLQVPG